MGWSYSPHPYHQCPNISYITSFATMEFPLPSLQITRPLLRINIRVIFVPHFISNIVGPLHITLKVTIELRQPRKNFYVSSRRLLMKLAMTRISISILPFEHITLVSKLPLELFYIPLSMVQKQSYQLRLSYRLCVYPWKILFLMKIIG